MKPKSTDIMSRREIADVLRHLTRKRPLSRMKHQNLIIFRLTIGAGLRAAEICKLQLRDVRVTGDRPHIDIRKEVGKGKKARQVPLWWDVGTLDALIEWKRLRVEDMFAKPTDPFVCVIRNKLQPSTKCITSPGRYSRPGHPLCRQQVGQKFKSCVRVLGPERQRQLHPHSGRHTFASYMIKERGVPAVSEALGHADVGVTSVYLHVLPEDLDRKGRVFDGAKATEIPDVPAVF